MNIIYSIILLALVGLALTAQGMPTRNDKVNDYQFYFAVLLIYTKEQQKFIESIDKVENVNFLFNSQDIIIIPADESFYDDGSFSIMPSLNSMNDIVELKTEIKKWAKCLPLCQLN
jgi:hypothetical protein